MYPAVRKSYPHPPSIHQDNPQVTLTSSLNFCRRDRRRRYGDHAKMFPDSGEDRNLRVKTCPTSNDRLNDNHASGSRHKGWIRGVCDVTAAGTLCGGWQRIVMQIH